MKESAYTHILSIFCFVAEINTCDEMAAANCLLDRMDMHVFFVMDMILSPVGARFSIRHKIFFDKINTFKNKELTILS